MKGSALSKFVKGDKVKVVRGTGIALKPGDVYTVAKQFFSFGSDFLTLEGKSGEWMANRFEKVTPKPPKFSKGDRVKINSHGEFHVHAGKVGTIQSYHPLKTSLTSLKDKGAEGYYLVKFDNGVYSPGVWDVHLEANGATFKRGDRVTVKSNAPRHVGKGGMVREAHPLGRDFYYIVDIDGSGTDKGGLWERFLTAEVATPKQPKQFTETFKAGDRVVTVTVPGYGAVDEGKTVAVVGVTSPNGFEGVYHRVREDDGRQFNAYVKAAPVKAEPIRVGDTVKAVSVPYMDSEKGKTATVVRLHSENWGGGYPDTNAYVKFEDGSHAYATVEAITGQAFERAALDARIKAGKMDKLQRLAKELGYVVTPA